MSAPSSRAERWFRALLHLYPADFREEMGDPMVEAYLDRTRQAAATRGAFGVAIVCLRALADSIVNGIGERLRPAVTWRRTGNWGRDTELAVRRLVRSPLFALSMIGTLVVGLGAFAVVYAVIDKVLLEPLPYARPHDLYFVWRDYTGIIDLKRGWVSGPDVSEIAKVGGPIADAAGIRRERRTLAASRAAEGDPEEIEVMLSTDNLFDVLGVRPLLGRTFARGESGEGRPGLVVLGYDLWQRRFAADGAVLGTDVRINGAPFRVIGVMPRDFHFVRHSSLGAPERADAYVTFAYDLAAGDAHSGAFSALVRAKPGASAAAVTAAITSVGRTMDERFFKKQGVKLYPVALQPDLVAPVRPALAVLGLSGAFLVLVLALNLATLLLTRAVQREREFAVSRALGANSVALVRATLLESVMLGALGGVGATLAALWATRVLVGLAPIDLPRRESIVVDWSVALVVVGIGALLGLVAGLAPAFWASRSSLGALLRNVAARGGGRSRLRRSLVVLQVALSLVLLSTGGLVARSFERLLRASPGFEPSGVLTMRVPIAQWRYPDNASAVAFDERFQRELAAIPGVQSVGAASTIPLTANTDQGDVVFPGAPGNTGKQEHDAPLIDAMTSRTGWFATLGIRVLEGRDFEPRRPGAQREAIIDRTLAETFYPGGGAVSNRARIGKDTMTIVGVVDHARQYDLHRDGRPQVYLNDADDTYGALYFAVRTKRPPLELVPEVRATLHRLDPQLALSQVRTLDDVVGESLRQQRVSAVLIAGFSLGALLLASMGLFGIVAGAVTRRKHEMAVRLALGAERGQVLRMLVAEGGTLVVLGAVLAVPGVWMAGRALRGVLVGVSPFDPATLTAVALALGLVALLACWLPARRVGGIDPARALREY